MINKKIKRIRRAKRTRIKIKSLKHIRLCIHRTSRHIYAQIISRDGSKTLAVASTLEANLKKNFPYSGNIEAAIIIGKIIAQRALMQNIKIVSFDRSGFMYHGRIKALADSARKHGLSF